MVTLSTVATSPIRGVALDEGRGDLEAGARGRDGGEDQDVRISPPERPFAVGRQHGGGWEEEVGPPHAERQPGSGHADQAGVHAPTLVLDHCGERGDGADDALSERDDRQQPVALSDVMGVPWRSPLARLGDPRAGELDEDQRECQQELPQERGVDQRPQDPTDLSDQDRRHVGEAGAAPSTPRTSPRRNR
jgi:hypothetical protein